MRGRWCLLLVGIVLASVQPAASQVTYTESTLHVSEYDFTIKNVTVDGDGNVYYYTLARLIEKVSPEGVYTNLSGFGGTVIRGLIPPDPSAGTLALDVALQMQDNNANLVADSAGNLYFYQDGIVLRLQASDLTIYRHSGRGLLGAAWTMDGADGLETAFSYTGNMAIDASGNIYFGHYPAPANPHLMRLNVDGTVDKVGGGNGRGEEGVNGPAVDAQLGSGRYDGLTVDPLGNIFLADDRVLRRIGTDGVLTVIHDGGDGVADHDFTGQDISTVSIGAFNSVAAGPDGSLFFEADGDVHQLSPDGTVTTIATTGDAGHIAVDSEGNVYFANNANTGSSDDHSIVKLTRSTPFTGTPQVVGGAVADGGNTGGGDTGGGDTGDTGDGDTGTTVELPTGDVGPVGLDLDTTFGDQGLRQTAENPAAGDNVTVDIFFTEGALGNAGYEVTLKWDPAELAYSSFSNKDIFTGALPIPTATDSTVQLSNAIFGAGASASADAGTAGQAVFEVKDTFSGVATITLIGAKLGTTEVTIGPGAAFVVIGGQTAVELTPAEAANFDGDPTVGFGDFLIFAGGFGKTSADGDFDSRLDLDGDGSVGFGDFLMFAAVFGQTI